MAPKAVDQNIDQHHQQQQQREHTTKPPQKSLRICCYGSSSSRTQERYTNDAFNLGYTLCERGHTCVNGAGKFGCMGALNSGAEDASKNSKSSSNLGKVVGVIHEMFIKDTVGGEGGSSSRSSSSGNGRSRDWLTKCAPVFSTCENAEIHIAGGNDLQERKRMLVEGVDALIVMPGGPGTFDEVWEMACSKQIGIINIPIVCINIDGYYDPFRSILQRAHEDEFLYKHPNDILHFEPTSAKALEWIEKKLDGSIDEDEEKKRKFVLTRQKSLLQRMMSTFSLPLLTVPSLESDESDDDSEGTNDIGMKYLLVFTIGLSFGLASVKFR